MKMFKAIYRGGFKPQERKVYSVRLDENGTTYFLIFDYDEWKWADSYWFAPKEEDEWL